MSARHCIAFVWLQNCFYNVSSKTHRCTKQYAICLNHTITFDWVPFAMVIGIFVFTFALLTFGEIAFAGSTILWSMSPILIHRLNWLTKQLECIFILVVSNQPFNVHHSLFDIRAFTFSITMTLKQQQQQLVINIVHKLCMLQKSNNIGIFLKTISLLSELLLHFNSIHISWKLCSVVWKLDKFKELFPDRTFNYSNCKQHE